MSSKSRISRSSLTATFLKRERQEVMKWPTLTTILIALLGAVFLPAKDVSGADGRPNVVLVMTDDQGYGDLGCNGNKVIKTPTLDALHAESVRLTNYHVDPTCSPTRSALMTGRYSSRTGVWHTIMGRSLLHPDEWTVAEVLAWNKYKTGAFGKWHLGDNYPSRPQDQGFHEVLVHGGGGVGQTPDFWDNDYFDDTYGHNGKPAKQTGYCTDVFFDAALKFIEANKDRPFFAYIPTNAAHGPFNVAKKYSQPYKKLGVPSPRAEFYGMITNIDENMARLIKKLKELGLEKNTILIFTTDNGTAAGAGRRGGYNAGMRGTKGSEYEGGHRVPFFIRWPGGRITGGRDVTQLTAHVDVLPTLAELCGIELPKGLDIDGKSLVPLLQAEGSVAWPERTLVVHSQRIEHPQKWRKSAVMTARWRLINGKELFDLTADPGQRKNVAADHAPIVRQLRGAYERWYQHISHRFDDYVRIAIGSADANPVSLTCHDWHTNNKPVPWHQTHIKRDAKNNGFWAVEVLRGGKYRFTLRGRPAGIAHQLKAGTARLKLGDIEVTAPIKSGSKSVTLLAELKVGKSRLQTWLDENDGASRGAFFVEVKYVD